MDKYLIFSKAVGYARLTADSLVSQGPCFLISADLIASAVGAATAVIRDGNDANSEAVVDLTAVTSYSDSRTFDPPIFLKRGLFVDVGSNVAAVLVRYLPSPGGG